MNYGGHEAYVLHRTLSEGLTIEKMESERNSIDEWEHYRAYESACCDVNYMYSNEYPVELEVYSKLVEVIKPYAGSVLAEDVAKYCIDIDFHDWDSSDGIRVYLDYDEDFQERYDAKYDEYPASSINGSLADIVDYVKSALEEFAKEKESWNSNT